MSTASTDPFASQREPLAPQAETDSQGCYTPFGPADDRPETMNLLLNYLNDNNIKQEDREVLPKESSSSPFDVAIAAFMKAVAPIDAERLKLAVEFTEHFNALARSLPTATYEDKKTSAKILNAELRSRGFAVKCPKTGLPSFLLVRPDDAQGLGRFHFAHPEGGKTETTASRNELPDFEIILEMPGPTPGESRAGGSWAEGANARQKRGRRNRG